MPKRKTRRKQAPKGIVDRELCEQLERYRIENDLTDIDIGNRCGFSHDTARNARNFLPLKNNNIFKIRQFLAGVRKVSASPVHTREMELVRHA